MWRSGFERHRWGSLLHIWRRGWWRLLRRRWRLLQRWWWWLVVHRQPDSGRNGWRLQQCHDHRLRNGRLRRDGGALDDSRSRCGGAKLHATQLRDGQCPDNTATLHHDVHTDDDGRGNAGRPHDNLLGRRGSQLFLQLRRWCGDGPTQGHRRHGLERSRDLRRRCPVDHPSLCRVGQQRDD